MERRCCSSRESRSRSTGPTARGASASTSCSPGTHAVPITRGNWLSSSRRWMNACRLPTRLGRCSLCSPPGIYCLRYTPSAVVERITKLRSTPRPVEHADRELIEYYPVDPRHLICMQALESLDESRVAVLPGADSGRSACPSCWTTCWLEALGVSSSSTATTSSRPTTGHE